MVKKHMYTVYCISDILLIKTKQCLLTVLNHTDHFIIPVGSCYYENSCTVHSNYDIKLLQACSPSLNVFWCVQVFLGSSYLQGWKSCFKSLSSEYLNI